MEDKKLKELLEKQLNLISEQLNTVKSQEQLCELVRATCLIIYCWRENCPLGVEI